MQTEVLDVPKTQQTEFTIYAVNRDLLPAVANWPLTGGFRSYHWISSRRSSESPKIAAGDKLDLSIWDSEENSLLTAPGQRAVTMNQIVVAADGTIFLPYLDRIKVSGMTAVAARAKIQDQLLSIIPSAQVQLTLISGRRNSIDMVSGVAKPGNYPLDDQNVTVLNMISLGGGIPTTMRNPQIRLTRNGRIYGTSVARLYANPGADVPLKGGDKVIVQEDNRYFLALGATGKEQITYFEQDRITALDALTMVAGISDGRADPQGILVLREYPGQSAVGGTGGPNSRRVIFTIDLTTADGLFSAKQFVINPGDLVLATESPVNTTQKIFGLISGAFSVAKLF